VNKWWRKLDNMAKIFSLEDKRYNNTFRLSVMLKDSVDADILKSAITLSLNKYSDYKVKIGVGLFWNYFEYNSNDPVVEQESQTPCKSINFRKNKGFLFKVTYFNNKINLDMFHALTDGRGATVLFKEIIYNYLNLKYNLDTISYKVISNVVSNKDAYLSNVDKKIKCRENYKKVYLIKGKTSLRNNKFHHYILNLDKFKIICKRYNVSITEYLTALYIFALYKTVYVKKSKKDIAVTVPIDLRKYYNVETCCNFFTCMNIEGNVCENKKITFNKLLKQVKNEFKNKLTSYKIKTYLNRDVKLGTNMAIRLVPLFAKKLFMKYFGKMVSQNTTTTLSNIGPINIDNNYKEYIDNIMILANAGKIQKLKCTICSYENNLTVTINSNLIGDCFENEFHSLLEKYVGNVRVESNVI